MGTSGPVLAQGSLAPVTKGARVWATAGVNAVGLSWAEPCTKVGRDTCLDRMAVFSVVLFRGAAGTVEATPSAIVTTAEGGDAAPRSTPGTVPAAGGVV